MLQPWLCFADYSPCGPRTPSLFSSALLLYQEADFRDYIPWLPYPLALIVSRQWEGLAGCRRAVRGRGWDIASSCFLLAHLWFWWWLCSSMAPAPDRCPVSFASAFPKLRWHPLHSHVSLGFLAFDSPSAWPFPVGCFSSAHRSIRSPYIKLFSVKFFWICHLFPAETLTKSTTYYVTLSKGHNLLWPQVLHMQNQDNNVLYLMRLFKGNNEIMCFERIYFKASSMVLDT